MENYLREENLVIGEKYVFGNHRSSNHDLQGSIWEYVGKKENSNFWYSFKLLKDGKIKSGLTIGREYDSPLDYFLQKVKPYVYQPIKHAYFYHSVGD